MPGDAIQALEMTATPAATLANVRAMVFIVHNLVDAFRSVVSHTFRQCVDAGTVGAAYAASPFTETRLL
jgi:hypothetical protein